MGTSEIRTVTSKFSKGVIDIRLWEERNLPLSQSRVAFDLFILIAHCSCTLKPLTLKRLFSTLKYSERGVRNVLEQFIVGGWCEVVCDTDDKRCRYIMATKRLTDAFESYKNVVLNTYLQCIEQDK